MAFDDFALEGLSGGDRLKSMGFRWGQKGTHTSRTIMLAELRLLLATSRSEAIREDYIHAIQEENSLGKRTVSTRRLSCQRLSELYALDPDVALFRIMRRLWYADHDGQPLLALLLALARDPLLRASAHSVLSMHIGEEFARQRMIDGISRAVGGRLNERILDKVVRNAASSWTQSGHLRGRGRKIRRRVSATAASAAFALLLGYLTGSRGASLFETPWARVLDAPQGDLLGLANNARRLGFLDMTQSGGVIEVAFARILAPDERR